MLQTPSFANGERLEILRDHACFGEDRAKGSPYERITYKTLEFSQEVVSAEVFLSGFNLWYTRQGHDHEIMQLRVDAWVELAAVTNPEFISKEEIERSKRQVNVKLMYSLTDEDTSDDDDFNDTCIGFTVIALTKLGKSQKSCF